MISIGHVEGSTPTIGPRLQRMLDARPGLGGARIFAAGPWVYVVSEAEPLLDPTGRALREVLAAKPGPSSPVGRSVVGEPVGPIPEWRGAWRLMVKGEVGFGAMRVERLDVHPLGVLIHWGRKRLLVPRAGVGHVVLDEPAGTHVLIPTEKLRGLILEPVN